MYGFALVCMFVVEPELNGKPRKQGERVNTVQKDDVIAPFACQSTDNCEKSYLHVHVYPSTL